MFREEKNLKGKILVLLVAMALLVGVLSGCIEDDMEDEEENNAPAVTMDDYTMDGMTVDFACTATDEDEDDTLTYSWDFGDEETSTDEDPQHVYAANGSYEVTVTASDGTDTATATETVIVGNIAPVALFTWVATNLSVVFTDASSDVNTDDALTYLWDFNDGAAQNTTTDPVTYVFAATGSYNVSLTVTDTWGLTDTYTETIDVTE